MPPPTPSTAPARSVAGGGAALGGSTDDSVHRLVLAKSSAICFGRSRGTIPFPNLYWRSRVVFFLVFRDPTLLLAHLPVVKRVAGRQRIRVVYFFYDFPIPI